MIPHYIIFLLLCFRNQFQKNNSYWALHYVADSEAQLSLSMYPNPVNMAATLTRPSSRWSWAPSGSCCGCHRLQSPQSEWAGWGWSPWRHWCTAATSLSANAPPLAPWRTGTSQMRYRSTSTVCYWSGRGRSGSGWSPGMVGVGRCDKEWCWTCLETCQRSRVLACMWK